jgi:hypothetical protein
LTAAVGVVFPPTGAATWGAFFGGGALWQLTI